jgi:asparagine synthase (glutamine-hydrolysing)
MCGFAGFVDCTERQHPNTWPTLARRMVDELRHRGPDSFGVWSDANACISMAHRRLAILDLSTAGNQPMTSGSGRYVLVFNGEIYNHLTLRQKLEAERFPYTFRGHSDTETLLAAFEAWGIEATLGRCVGMFAIALWDRASQCLHLMRDRMGEKPLYYGWAGAVFVFGSQLKALKMHPEFKEEIDRNVLALYFRHGCVPAPYSIYKNVWKLPPGSSIALSLQDVREHCLPASTSYWSLINKAEDGRASQFNGSDREALAELERLSAEAVELQRVADVPLGAFLSGGVDSSLMVALMQRQSVHRTQTFTIGFSEAGFDEARYARAVARQLGTEHTEIYIEGDQAKQIVARLPAVYDEPFADSSQIPTFLVSQMARHHVTVSLSGDGGDELFGGYNRYLLRSGRRQVQRVPLRLRKILAAGISSLPPHVLDAVLGPLGRLIPQLNVSHPSDKAYKAAEVLAIDSDTDWYRRLVTHWDDPSGLVMEGREPTTFLDQMLGLRAADKSFEQWMMTTDMLTYLPDVILTKVDRASMAVSLESRMPFLDHRLVEFSLTLPLHMKIRDGRGKWLLRQMLYKLVPKELIERPKMGFGVPIDTWLRGPLRDWADSLLDEVRLRREGFLNPAPIRQNWREHLAGTRNWQHQLWDVLMFEAWLELR